MDFAEKSIKERQELFLKDCFDILEDKLCGNDKTKGNCNYSAHICNDH
jgi:hypothetical protein